MPDVHVTPSSPHIGGRPHTWSYTWRSCAIVSLPYASTIAIVTPWPSLPAWYSGLRLYAARVLAGLKQRRLTELHCAWVGGVAHRGLGQRHRRGGAVRPDKTTDEDCDSRAHEHGNGQKPFLHADSPLS